MSIYFRENGNFYEVRFKDKHNNYKAKYMKCSISKYGKYAYDVAKYVETNGEKINNWFIENNDNITLYYYNNKTDVYEEIIIDKDDYDKVKEYYWSVYEDCHEKYACSATKGKKIKIHRLIMNVSDPNMIVDHIKGNGLNNMKSNLRVITRKENNQNKVNLASNNNSGVMGVYKQKSNGYDVYQARITFNGETKTKTFSISKYGEQKAFELACDARDLFLEEFNREFNMRNEIR